MIFLNLWAFLRIFDCCILFFGFVLIKRTRSDRARGRDRANLARSVDRSGAAASPTAFHRTSGRAPPHRSARACSSPPHRPHTSAPPPATSRPFARRPNNLLHQVNSSGTLTTAADARCAAPSSASVPNLPRARGRVLGDGGRRRRCHHVPLLKTLPPVPPRTAAVVGPDKLIRTR